MDRLVLGFLWMFFLLSIFVGSLALATALSEPRYDECKARGGVWVRSAYGSVCVAGPPR